MGLSLTLDMFPEMQTVLNQLKTAGLKTAILSNGTPMRLDSAVRTARIEGLLDAVLSIEEVRVYKPDPRVYQRAVDRLGIPSSQISFQSSNAWDAYAIRPPKFPPIPRSRAPAGSARTSSCSSITGSNAPTLPSILHIRAPFRSSYEWLMARSSRSIPNANIRSCANTSSTI